MFNGNDYTVVKNKEKISLDTSVYNLSIAQSHNFFIIPAKGSNEPILVHNTSGGGGGSGGGK